MKEHLDLGRALEVRFTGFTGFLRANGFGVGPEQSADLVDVANRVGLFDSRCLRWSFKALLCGRVEEWERFDELFDAYFLPPNKRSLVESRSSGRGALDRTPGRPESGGEQPESRAGSEEAGAEGEGPAHRGASREAALAQADFGRLNAPDEVRAIEALMRRFAQRLRALELRRERMRSHGRRLDVRATLRRSVSTGGVPLRIVWRDRQRVRPRLVLLLDVSRSMSLYSFFYLRLARSLSGLLEDLHVFLYHTQLTRVSEALRDPDPWRSQERLQLLSAGWAGGTRIGECLHTFNREHAARLVHSRTAVIVMSDGYDTGEPTQLAHELASLKRRARRLVWINPLMSRPGFAPVSRGMLAALPHLDLLAPGADLAAIEQAVPTIIRSLH